MVDDAEVNNLVIFDKNKVNELTHEEIWDDTLLIEQYDETMDQARKLLATKLDSASSLTDSDCSNSHRTEVVDGFSHSKSASSNFTKKKKRGKKKNEWHIGDPCRARYSEDGLIYEATIVGMNSLGTCEVRFVGYNNHEEVIQSSLLKSRGEGARRHQSKRASEENLEMPPPKSGSSNSKKPRRFQEPSFPHIPNLPPPPALGLVEGPDQMTSEALHTMLMSWYMTGYHTGYYQGLNRAKMGGSTKQHHHNVTQK